MLIQIEIQIHQTARESKLQNADLAESENILIQIQIQIHQT